MPIWLIEDKKLFGDVLLLVVAFTIALFTSVGARLFPLLLVLVPCVVARPVLPEALCAAEVGRGQPPLLAALEVDTGGGSTPTAPSRRKLAHCVAWECVAWELPADVVVSRAVAAVDP